MQLVHLLIELHNYFRSRSWILNNFILVAEMSRRSLPNDEKMISEMILDNISKVSNMNIDMNEIFNTEQMILLTTYKEMYNYDSYLSFFLSLILLSHCSQRSSYTHYLNSDRETLQLYYWLLGPSGKFNQYLLRL